MTATAGGNANETLEKLVWEPPQAWLDQPTHYCPGCGHGAAQMMLAELVDEMDVRERSIGVSTVGCAAYIHQYVDIDWVDPTHGRAPAMAAAVKRLKPDRLVFTYQGDGDLAAIGAGDVLHAAARGEQFTIILANNAVYGMTGGQMSSQSLVGQKTATTMAGRQAATHGYPLDWVRLLAPMPGVAYVARGAVNTPTNVRRTKRFVRKAFEHTLEGNGLAFVEILEMCPSGWRMSSQGASEWITDVMEPQFPLGEYKDGDRIDLPEPTRALRNAEPEADIEVGDFDLSEHREQGGERPD